ncbi:MAG: HAMP domain-containing histidine kinase [Acidobacteriia bacterium]|nr:HAMP domain-containing histidine kinase [Terriglobia bacterium]
MPKTRAELSRSIQESAERIDDVMERLGRLVNLSEGELRSADINELLSEVTLLHQEEIQAAGVRLEFDLQKPLPSLRCRPQLLSAVFSSLLANAIQAVNGDGRIRISSRLRDGELEVTIQDNGRGMSAEQADNVFDPSLRVSGNRVSSGNWSLFNARQIVYQHGGEIQIETAEGKGAAFHVTFPVDPG